MIQFKEDILKLNLSEKQLDIYESFKLRKGFLREFIKKSVNIDLTKEGITIAKEIKKNYLKFFSIFPILKLNKDTWALVLNFVTGNLLLYYNNFIIL